MNPDSIKNLLQSEDFGDRIRGVNHLRDIDKTIGFDLVKPMIKDDNVRVRYAAVSLLDTLGTVNPQECLEFLRDRLYNDPEADVKAAAADAIGGLQLTEAFPDLAQAYEQTSDWLIQFSIISTLGELGDPRGFDLLKKALESDNNLLKISAISAMGELGDKKALPILLPLIDDSDWQIRHRLAQSLGKLGGDEAMKALKTLTEDESELVSKEAKNYI